MVQKPTVLIIAEGYGLRNEQEGNAIALAKTPSLDRLFKEYSHSRISTSAASTGLQKGQAISCSAAYQQIGVGRIPKQQGKIIDDAIKKGEFFRNKELLEIIKYVKSSKSSLHFIGLLSEGGLHSHMSHLFALLELAQHHFLDKVYMHIILDGRDVETTSARKYLRQLDKFLEKNSTGSVSTVIGRHFAMTSNVEDFKKCYDMLTKGKGTLIRDPMEAVNSAYRKNLSDEYVEPTVINQGGIIKDKDAVLLYNFRTGASQSIIKAFTVQKRKKLPKQSLNIRFATLFSYEGEQIASAYRIPKEKNSLSEVLAGKRIRQLKVFESSKAKESIFFFNGNNKGFEKEDHKIFSTPKSPEKSPALCAAKIAKYTAEQIRNNKYPFILASLANIDLLGSTGSFAQTIKGVQAVDKAIGEIVKAVEKKKGVCIITSDHGKGEEMQDRFGRSLTSNTVNPVPFIYVGKGRKAKSGKLSDVAPTILKAMKIRLPKEMKGKSLV